MFYPVRLSLSLIKSVIGDEKSRLYSILMAGLAGGEARTLSYLLRPPGAVEGKISPDLHLHDQTHCAPSLSSLGEDLKLFLQSIHGLVRIFKHPKLSIDLKKIWQYMDGFFSPTLGNNSLLSLFRRSLAGGISRETFLASWPASRLDNYKYL